MFGGDKGKGWWDRLFSDKSWWSTKGGGTPTPTTEVTVVPTPAPKTTPTPETPTPEPTPSLEGEELSQRYSQTQQTGAGTTTAAKAGTGTGRGVSYGIDEKGNRVVVNQEDVARNTLGSLWYGNEKAGGPYQYAEGFYDRLKKGMNYDTERAGGISGVPKGQESAYLVDMAQKLSWDKFMQKYPEEERISYYPNVGTPMIPEKDYTNPDLNRYYQGYGSPTYGLTGVPSTTSGGGYSYPYRRRYYGGWYPRWFFPRYYGGGYSPSSKMYNTLIKWKV
jgi:hypothetical protein